MEVRFCDERGTAGFSWIVEEPMTRTSHALVEDGRVWLVDPVDWPEAIDRALSLAQPAGVIQLLDRHNRDCVALAERLGVPRVVAPDDLPGSPFECVPIMRRKRWQERKFGFFSICAIFGPLYHSFQACSLPESAKSQRTM